MGIRSTAAHGRMASQTASGAEKWRAEPGWLEWLSRLPGVPCVLNRQISRHILAVGDDSG